MAVTALGVDMVELCGKGSLKRCLENRSSDVILAVGHHSQ